MKILRFSIWAMMLVPVSILFLLIISIALTGEGLLFIAEHTLTFMKSIINRSIRVIKGVTDETAKK